MHALAVEATIDAAEVALEELQRLFTVVAADELQRLRLPPGIAVRTARLAEIAGLLGETAALLQGPVVATHSGDDEPSEPPPTGSGKGFASRMKTDVRTQGTRLTQRRHGSFSRAPPASGRKPWEEPSTQEPSGMAAAQFHAMFTGDAEPETCSSPPDAARARARARARALGEAHGQTAGSEQESEQESEEELGAEPGPPPSSSGRSGFASRIKTNVQTQGTRLNVRRQGSFSRKPVTRAGADVDSKEALSAEQAAVAFQAAFQADGGTARD